jgi:hypothetical protein
MNIICKTGNVVVRHIFIDTWVYQKVPELALLTKKYITYLSLNTISFEIVTLRSNALVTAFLPLLECGLEVILCKRVHNLL